MNAFRAITRNEDFNVRIYRTNKGNYTISFSGDAVDALKLEKDPWISLSTIGEVLVITSGLRNEKDSHVSARKTCVNTHGRVYRINVSRNRIDLIPGAYLLEYDNERSNYFVDKCANVHNGGKT